VRQVVAVRPPLRLQERPCRSRMEGPLPEDYAPFGERVLADFQNQTTVTHESDVAEAVWRAANDTTGQLRYPAGPDAVALAQLK
jgi:hypothetical protein